jgi:multidrug transporter EmrE-like cation transporter
MTTVLPRFEGSARPMGAALVMGGVGLAATWAGGLADAREASYGYLFAFAFWLSLCLGALVLLSAFHTARARWPTVLRRPLEVMAACCPLFILLFIPVALTMRHLFPWVEPSPVLGEHALHLLEHKRPYLNLPWFFIRAAVYFGVWCPVGLLLYRWSVRQDAEPASNERVVRMTLWQRRLAAGALPAVVLCLSFASLDWMMSLEPLWQSTVYALYVGCGAVVGAMAVVGLLAALGQGSGQFGALMSPVHFRKLGTLLLGFVCLWAYCAFSQLLLMWIATLPEEVTWYQARLNGAWRWLAALLALGHFAVPFLLLLLRSIKGHRRRLAAVCAWLLLMRGVDLYWLVLPALHPREWYPHWTSLTAFIGIGGLCVAACLWLLRGGYTVPVRDPFLLHSLRVPSHE